MTLHALLIGAGLDCLCSEADPEITGFCADTRRLRPGDLFVAMPSDNTDTISLIPIAKEMGASAVAVYSEEGAQKAQECGIAWAQLRGLEQDGFNADLGLIGRTFCGDPTAEMRIIGITGTNGKTTVAWLLRQALRALGRNAGYLGTLGYQGAGELEELGNTTPFPVDLWALLERAANSGITDLIMEVSSHSLSQHRISGVRFDAGVFTNLTQDHLDYHGTMEQYAEAKKSLFFSVAKASNKAFVAVLNADDETSSQWSQEILQAVALTAVGVLNPIIGLAGLAYHTESYEPNLYTYGSQTGSITFEVQSVQADSLQMIFSTSEETGTLNAKVGGSFNVQNCAAAVATLRALGYSLEEACRAVGEADPAPGRFEAVPCGKGFSVIVDYAHTPDALEKLLRAARELKPNRLTCVFGCGGDRDKTKRPIMAKTSSELADFTVLTSDNPRTEDPEQILRDCAAGLVPEKESVCILDRREAIVHAIASAQPGDLVVIAGKGHEDYQIIGREKVHFDDREVARQAIEERA